MGRSVLWEPPDVPFRAEHVRKLGVTRGAIRGALAAARIVRLAHGVYVRADALPEDPVGRHIVRAAAHQLVLGEAVASHGTAALAHGLALPDPSAALSVLQFTEPAGAGRRSRRRGDLAVSVRDLPAEHRTTHPSGLVLTTPARTAVDLAADLPLPEALVVLDSALRLELANRYGTASLRDRANSPRTRSAAGEALARTGDVAATRLSRGALALALTHADPRRESALESLSYGAMVVAGLPLPVCQAGLDSSLGLLYPDFLWAEQRVIGEADGKVKYRDPESLYREKVRQEVLEQELGYRVLRWSYADIAQRPWTVMQRIAAALAMRA